MTAYEKRDLDEFLERKCRGEMLTSAEQFRFEYLYCKGQQEFENAEHRCWAYGGDLPDVF